jgi:hypothetical protein
MYEGTPVWIDVMLLSLREIDAYSANWLVTNTYKQYRELPRSAQKSLYEQMLARAFSAAPNESPGTSPIRPESTASSLHGETACRAEIASDDASRFGWKVTVLGTLGPMWVSQCYLVQVVLYNRSERMIGLGSQISLSYHWRLADLPQSVVVRDGKRSELHPDLWPNEGRQTVAEVIAPEQPGRYLLEWDLVEEGITWFSGKGFAGPQHEVEVLLPWTTPVPPT